MKRLLLKGGLLCLLSFVTCLAWAEDTDNLTAYWDWENNKPEGIQSFTGYEGSSGDFESSISGIYLHVDATSGKFGPNSGTPQFTSGAKLQVPVASTSDVVTFKGYNDLAYTIGGGDQKTSTGNEDTYTVTDADVAQGYVEIVSYSSGGFMYSVKATYASEEEINSLKDTSVTATWSWQNDTPTGIVSNTSFNANQGDPTTGFLDSDLTVDENTVKLYVDATASGAKLAGNGNNVQFNNGTKILVPVVSTDDVVTVYGYQSESYLNYTVAGTAATEYTTTYTAQESDVEQGYVEIASTGSCYLFGITVKYASDDEIAQINYNKLTGEGDDNNGDDQGNNQGDDQDDETDGTGVAVEKALYTTSFTEWPTISSSSAGTTNTVTTNYSNENLTFTLVNTSVDPEGNSFSGFTGYMKTEKATSPSITTSALKSVTKITLTQVATGNDRGITVSVKGDEDSDWTSIYSDPIDSNKKSTGDELSLDVNRTNCQIMFGSYDATQNAYVTDLAIYGNITVSEPTLSTFTLNGTEYDAYNVFTKNANGDMEGTVNISKKDESVTVSNVTTDYGTVSETDGISYDTSGDETVVTITVAGDDGETVTYKLTVGKKPDFTVSYIGLDGTTVIGTQTVEQDDSIGTFAKTAEDITVDEGYVFRGWFVSADGGRKYSTSDIITGNTNLYAVETEVETESTTARYEYDLTDEYFYPEDHEAINPTGSGAWHDTTHGWVFGDGDTIDLLVGGNAYILLDLCQYSDGSTTISLSNDNSIDAQVSTDGASAALEYNGEGGTITLKINGGTVYIHSITIINVEDNPIAMNDAGWYVVEAGNADHLLNTLDIANANAGSERTYIFIPDGTYDLGSKTLTQISGNNMSIIGQSMDNTIIVNTPETESINATATFLVTGENCYFQDLTLENDFPYYEWMSSGGTSGRAVCLQDKGNHTICKNVKMLSYQDTYYSNSSASLPEMYFETSEIHGTVDFICGNSAVYFQNCDIVVESRSADSNSGSCVITAPATGTDLYGYIFNGCNISNSAASYTFGRGWQDDPECVFMNTTLNDSGLSDEHWTLAGMNTLPKRFYEYNTLDANGSSNNSLTNNVLTFTYNGESTTYETILTETEAKQYELGTVFTDWTPATYATQLEMGDLTVSEDSTSISWSQVSDALAYAIFKDGEFVDIVDSSTSTYTISGDGTYTVRAANSYGGFGENSEEADITTMINDASADNGSVVNSVYYNLSGSRVSSATKGVVIKVDTMENGKQVATKIVK